MKSYFDKLRQINFIRGLWRIYFFLLLIYLPYAAFLGGQYYQKHFQSSQYEELLKTQIRKLSDAVYEMGIFSTGITLPSECEQPLRNMDEYGQYITSRRMWFLDIHFEKVPVQNRNTLISDATSILHACIKGRQSKLFLYDLAKLTLIPLFLFVLLIALSTLRLLLHRRL